ncbi:MAG TPA: hypothetical protein PLI27_00840 [Ignavibacteriales bacterium]|nr:hypothetical protein [Ignavibacteriales bacterium]HOL80232.1 hypothetical protein [Ignavibacteriales bacterium]HOM64513.1 hypothetical protein [Ignavibacteriales bacterium]HPD66610.1 hypothetical protein [Ignavibacteriales bacterium]HPP32421.1 hypothetical protein [Ignavibacteriales bacterium]
MKRLKLLLFIFTLTVITNGQLIQFSHLSGPFGGQIGAIAFDGKNYLYGGLFDRFISYKGIYKSTD